MCFRDVKIDLCRGKIGEEDKCKRDKKRLCLGKALGFATPNICSKLCAKWCVLGCVVGEK